MPRAPGQTSPGHPRSTARHWRESWWSTSLGVGMPLVKAEGRLGRQIATSTLTRVLILPLSAVASLINARMAIDALGLEGYGIVGLIVSLPQVLPITDLGFGAAVTNAAAVAAEHGHQSLNEAWTRA